MACMERAQDGKITQSAPRLKQDILQDALESSCDVLLLFGMTCNFFFFLPNSKRRQVRGRAEIPALGRLRSISLISRQV